MGLCLTASFVFVWLCGLVFVGSGSWLEMCVKFGAQRCVYGLFVFLLFVLACSGQGFGDFVNCSFLFVWVCGLVSLFRAYGLKCVKFWGFKVCLRRVFVLLMFVGVAWLGVW